MATRVARIRADAQTGGKRLAPEAIALLAAIPWQDDLSELRAALARLVADVARDEIQVDDVLAHVRFESAPSGTLRSARRQFERDYIALVLQHHRGSVGDAARALGIQRTNLYRKARQLGISVARPALSIAIVALLATAAPAAGQTEGRFQSGILTWTPTLTLRDAGVDSNVYDEAVNPRRDGTAIFTPAVAGVFDFAAADLQFTGSADFVYFQRYANERSINRRGSARFDLELSRIKPFVGATYFEGRERVNSEIDVRARRTDSGARAGVAIQLTPRSTLELAGDFGTSRFLQGASFRDVDLAQRMNRETTGGSARFAYELTPLTRIVAEAGASQDRYTLSPAYNADNTSARAGFEFEPDAMVKGRAVVGFHRIEPVGELSFGYRGLTASVELGYVLLGRTRVDVRVQRDTNYSFTEQPFYIQRLYGGEVRHNLLGPLDVIGRLSQETLAYPGIPERLLPADTVEITRYGGGVAIRPGERVNLSINYELTDRASQLPDRSYDRRRLFTTLTYGF